MRAFHGEAVKHCGAPLYANAARPPIHEGAYSGRATNGSSFVERPAAVKLPGTPKISSEIQQLPYSLVPPIGIRWRGTGAFVGYPTEAFGRKRLVTMAAKIMVVDDNDGIRQSLKQLLAEHPGWSVCAEAVNGRDAVILANERSPDLVVLDFAMPLMDGVQAAAQIRKTLPRLPIVLYTMHKNTQIEVEAQNAGIQRVVSKGDPASVLVDCLKELLNPSMPEVSDKPTSPKPEQLAARIARSEAD
jgi:CheY-like chemotaxis protein